MTTPNDFPFNELTSAQVELLALLSEECAEVIQIVGKILRHGYESTHPDNPEGRNNRDMLETELGHVQCAVNMLAVEEVDLYSIRKSAQKKSKKVKVYLHHQ